MKLVNYGNSSKLVGRIGFGGWQLGNKDNWEEMSFADGVALVKEAYAQGIRLFDTAPNYAGGMSETIIGEALKDVREHVVINSKVGHLADGSYDFSVTSLETQIRDSLGRLQTNYLDSVILHNPQTEVLQGKTGHFPELKRLRELGLIRAYGVSIDTYQELKTTIEKTDSQVIEILFNAFFQEPAAIFPFLKARKIALLAKVPLDSGWLTGKYGQTSVFSGIRARWDEKTIRRRAILVEKLKQITGETDLTATALAFVLSYDAVTAVIPGIRNHAQLETNIQAETRVMPLSIKQRIIDLYNQQIKNDPLPW